MKISAKEIEEVSKLKPIQRYHYFIKRVADNEKMYSLVDRQGYFALANINDNVLFSVWTAPEFALSSAIDKWKEFEVKEIILEEFEDHIIDEIEKNNWLMNVFSIGSKSGFVVSLNEFARDLNEEMKKYH